MIASLIDHLWQSTLVVLVAALLVYTLRNHAARVRYWVWFAASLKFLVPFAALVALGNTLEWRAATVEPRVASAGLAEQLAAPSSALTLAVAPTAIFTAPDDRVAFAALLGAIWLAGIGVVAGVWLVRALRLSRLARLAMPLTHDRFAHLGIEVRLSSAMIEPGIVGIFRPVLMLPEGILQRLNAERLDAVIEHELCHVRRRDNLTAAVHMAVEAAFWFHPLVWWIGTRLVEERERACDEAVVASGADPHAYAEGILEVCRLYVESPLPCAAGIGGGAALKRRIRRIAEHWTARSLSPIWSAGLATAALAIPCVPVVIGAVTPSALAQPAVARGAAFENTSIARGDGVSPNSFQLGGGVLDVRNVSLRRLIGFAYDVQGPRIGGSAAIDERRYTIYADAPSSPHSAFPGMLRTLLEERFALEVHRETQSMAVLVLGRATDGASRLPAAVEPTTRQYLHIQEQSIEVENLPLRMVTGWLSSVFGKPVVDETGLGDGAYTFDLQWKPTDPPSAESLGELNRALGAQLGLSLLEAERSVERLIVDRVAEPTGVAAAPPAAAPRVDSGPARARLATNYRPIAE